MRVRRGFWVRALAVALPALLLLVVAPATPASASVTIVPQVECVGDGTSGHRVKLIYAYEPGFNRFAEKEPLIRHAAWVTQQNVNDSARRDGAERWVRFETTGSTGCDVAIDSVQVPAGSSPEGWKAALQNAGYTDDDRIYIGYFENGGGCGKTSSDDRIDNDDSPGSTNKHNSFATWISLEPNCATGHEMTHELAHALGGILENAPNHVDGYHCSDSNETLCQGGPTPLACPDGLATRLMDCNKDDYFGVTPVGTYLNNNWNAANDSAYLEHGSSVPTMTTIPALPAQLLSGVDVQGTEIAFTFESSSKVSGAGITHEVDLLRDGTVVATVEPWRPTIRVTGLPTNTSAGYQLQERVTQNGVTRTSDLSEQLIILTGSGTGVAGGVDDGIATIFTSDVLDGEGKPMGIDVYGHSTDENASIVQYGLNSYRNQQWRLDDAGGGTYTIKSRFSDKCLAPLGGSGTAGTTVVQVTCTGAAPQKWTFPTISGVTYQLKAGVGTNMCVQSAGGSGGSGAALVLATCDTATPSQRWTSNQIF
ncbi:RICIN domain-containing protein [Spongiactinospora sp. TRM90649]|uniref:RICIN domain-containing protein n=1 Tax=Spongiactinospora sp. TRM90649 TaxID=3031114 RepID=UPI0023F6AB3F|nr:RICIN domain-containing protein [Spongiactinospora sp. TRM90649]MDF5756223.1 RICIN domain-containing protein [Spongiactinospora sp. TRM90649]